VLKNDSIVFPEYYKVSFHCYNEGNLCWSAALDAEAANTAVLGDSDRIRSAFVEATTSYMKRRSLRPEMDSIIDVGCSTGISTEYAARLDLCANVTGIDLSPYFLAVAQTRRNMFDYVHSNAEETPFPSSSFDAASIAFVLHELPAAAAERVILEVSRILRRGGLIAILDMGSRIKASGPVKQFIFSKTEPYLEEYMSFTSQLKDVLDFTGFVGFETVAVDSK
ncbi:unnamed protein product, partial [Phaeothamnion confervicola]